jgi:hypothetical protein
VLSLHPPEQLLARLRQQELLLELLWRPQVLLLELR